MADWLFRNTWILQNANEAFYEYANWGHRIPSGKYRLIGMPNAIILVVVTSRKATSIGVYCPIATPCGLTSHISANICSNMILVNPSQRTNMNKLMTCPHCHMEMYRVSTILPEEQWNEHPSTQSRATIRTTKHNKTNKPKSIYCLMTLGCSGIFLTIKHLLVGGQCAIM